MPHLTENDRFCLRWLIGYILLLIVASICASASEPQHKPIPPDARASSTRFNAVNALSEFDMTHWFATIDYGRKVLTVHDPNDSLVCFASTIHYSKDSDAGFTFTCIDRKRIPDNKESITPAHAQEPTPANHK